MNNNIKYWEVLKINGDEFNRELAIAFLEQFHCGVHDKKDSSEIFFNKVDKKHIEMIIKNKSNISRWEWNKVEKQDWNKFWKPFFKNIEIKNKVAIIPSWEKIHPDNDKIVIKIEPGMAFGTGHHETTAMMIEGIINYLEKGMNVLDVGSGSGILSILSKKMGADKILSIDNDIEVVENFNSNLKLNNISIELKVIDCLDIKDFNYNVILANLNKQILLDFIPNIPSNNNLLIISGILVDDFKVIKEFLKKFEILEVLKKNEWLCLIIRT